MKKMILMGALLLTLSGCVGMPMEEGYGHYEPGYGGYYGGFGGMDDGGFGGMGEGGEEGDDD